MVYVWVIVLGRPVPPRTLLVDSPKFQLNVYGGIPPVAVELKLIESPTTGWVGAYERLVCGARFLKNSVMADVEPSWGVRGERPHAVSMVVRSGEWLYDFVDWNFVFAMGPAQMAGAFPTDEPLASANVTERAAFWALR